MSVKVLFDGMGGVTVDGVAFPGRTERECYYNMKEALSRIGMPDILIEDNYGIESKLAANYLKDIGYKGKIGFFKTK